MRAGLLLLPAAALLAMAGGCSTLPQAGPRGAAVANGASALAPAEPAPLPYALVPLSARVVGALDSAAPRAAIRGAAAVGGGEEGRAAARPAAPAGTLGPGDVVAVTVFESQSGGLFIPPEPGSRPGNFVNLPAQQVDRAGNISVPFAGAVRAAGQTPAEVERAVARRLAGRALDPQVLVSLVERRAAHVSVTGDVNASLRFPLDPGGERLLGAVARAGGPRFPAFETRVTLQRGGRSEAAWLSDVMGDPAQNVPLLDGDTVLLNREQRFFVALGAVGQTASITQLNRRFAFEDSRLSLAGAVARAGGLQDDRAEAASVFLFRQEDPRALRLMGVAVPEGAREALPVVYRADFGDPGTLFLANRFEMRPEDVIFVATAGLVEYEKVMRYLLPLTSSASGAAAVQR